jgi:uncharacterized membrane protein
MRKRRLRVVVGVLAAAGIAVAAYLTYARYTETAIACATGGCETVQSSRYAEVAGLPVALLGLGAYLAILASAFSASELACAGAAAVALGGAAFSAYLLYIQFAVIARPSRLERVRPARQAASRARARSPAAPPARGS